MIEAPDKFDTVEDCVEAVVASLGNDIVLGAPLGIGKPNQLMNAFYHRAKRHPEMSLKILSGLSLELPRPKSEIEGKFLHPFVERVFGGFCELDYMLDLRKNQLPPNVEISEFYFKAGAMKNLEHAQRHYISSNYTHIARDLLNAGVNVLVQQVAQKDIDGVRQYSLSSNTDVSLDLIPMLLEKRQDGFNFVAIAQTHADMPFMHNAAIVAPEYFDMVIDSRDYDTTLFAPPNMAIPPPDSIIGLYASALIKDGGTLQIGIGSMGDAIVYACLLRQQDNQVYKEALQQLNVAGIADTEGATGTFEKGLYGSSEMFVNGFLHLINAGIVKRQVFDDLIIQHCVNTGLDHKALMPSILQQMLEQQRIQPILTQCNLDYLVHWGIFNEDVVLQDDQLVLGTHTIANDLGQTENFEVVLEHFLGDTLKQGIHMHGGFFLGPADFYEQLRSMPEQEQKKIGMTTISHTNQLSNDHELLVAQRRDARFINTGMMVTLGGGVVSDGLEDGTVVSGVGGQYNFVAMAHELPGARSILCVRSTRGGGKHEKSNIVPHYGHITIPRHLRDIIVTEYGIADLRGKSDEQIVIALINIADSRFQDELLEYAKQHGKLRKDYAVPAEFQKNLPENINKVVGQMREWGHFPAFPLSTDFTEEEIALGRSLKDIKAQFEDPKLLIRSLIKSMLHSVDEKEAEHFLKRIDLLHPHTTKDNLLKHLILLELEENGYLKAL